MPILAWLTHPTAGDLLRALQAAADGQALGRLAQLHDAAMWTRALKRGGALVPRERVRALSIELALRGRPLRDPALAPLGVEGALLPIERELHRCILHFGEAAGSLSAAGATVQAISPDWLLVADPLVVEAWSSDAELPHPSPFTAVVDPWVERSNGRIEARIVRLDRAVGRHVPEDLLRALLPLGPRVEASPIAPATALMHLFSAAHGGAYGPSRSDAEARDLAWTNLRALVGGETNEETAERAERCGFTHIADNGFFDNVFWDLGLAVVTDDRLIVIAATDTD